MFYVAVLFVRFPVLEFLLQKLGVGAVSQPSRGNVAGPWESLARRRIWAYDLRFFQMQHEIGRVTVLAGSHAGVVDHTDLALVASGSHGLKLNEIYAVAYLKLVLSIHLEGAPFGPKHTNEVRAICQS